MRGCSTRIIPQDSGNTAPKNMELCLLAIGGSSQKENINSGNTVPKILELYFVSDVFIDTQQNNNDSGPQEI